MTISPPFRPDPLYFCASGNFTMRPWLVSLSVILDQELQRGRSAARCWFGWSPVKTSSVLESCEVPGGRRDGGAGNLERDERWKGKGLYLPGQPQNAVISRGILYLRWGTFSYFPLMNSCIVYFMSKFWNPPSHIIHPNPPPHLFVASLKKYYREGMSEVYAI